MTQLSAYALHLICSNTLQDKLLPPPLDLEFDIYSGPVPEKPGRDKKIEYSDKKVKIPRLEHLEQEHNRGTTMHHFANHELMAIELFAWALLRFSHQLHEKFKRDILHTIQEEQKHLALYLDRMNDFDVELGDRPLNRLFWKQLPIIQTPENFFSVMALSFEGANLDYALIYKKTFSYFDDTKSAAIMNTVFRDELKHVVRGLKIFRHYKPEGMDDWEFYTSTITWPFTPRRAKGYVFHPETRRKTGLDERFINELEKFEDEYSHRVKSPLLDTINKKITN